MGQNVRFGPFDRPGKLESPPEELKQESIIKEQRKESKNETIKENHTRNKNKNKPPKTY